MNVLFISPGYPPEMTEFGRGLAQCGARVIGLGEHPVQELPGKVRNALADYIQVPTLVDSDAIISSVRRYHSHAGIDRVECLWEPFMTLAAQIREAIGVGGMHTAQTELFRDKEKMKQALDAAGLRTPRHTTATGADAIRVAAAEIGMP
ncbi:MAG: ATP-grasp domain-containing protein, partial [Gammaproteobacteria bacterium]